ncbi:3-oxoacyl-ACP reductase [Sphaerisporangium krabiense]|uniref:3-oxoacyl-[acyl-carrier protein] reductase n=1 Tax=Sphaerisporangium krabiense TaxID=763782 RepID=A0A7W8Z8B6_9ACTN|nr:SDR family oxidoreductase [Sphaerisporangium krabiense]MBB5629252.1 3-oxoacyl-[acyl-carrier protein] reductase [Sphaerisporangium krabiense]GII67025.1 3-oxoacyl-ACP reductase [Sphaerisporangium krabiense]
MAALQGKRAVVTGGSRGIGRAIVERLARDGAAVVFSYASNAEAAAQVEKVVAEAGGRAHAVRADLAEAGAAERLMEIAEERLGAVDILVNNAALSFTPAPLAELDEELYDQAMTVNARAVFLTVRHAARHMPDGGRIINISTLNTTRPAPGIAPYAASKGAVEQLTAVAAMELGARGITVNTVSPGATDTDLLRGTNSAEALETAAQVTALGRLGQPADVADVVAFLAGPDARWITSQNIHATGGLA